MYLLVFCYTLHFVTPFVSACSLCYFINFICSVSICTIIIRLFTKLIVAVLSIVFHTPRFLQYVTDRYIDDNTIIIIMALYTLLLAYTLLGTAIIIYTSTCTTDIGVKQLRNSITPKS